MAKKLGRKTERNSKIKKFLTVVKKANEQEKFKSQARKAEKKNKPRGYQAKRFGVFSFWFIFILMFVVFLVNTVSSNGKSDVKPVSIEVNQATSAEAIEFSKEFLSKYFTWVNVGNFNSDAKEKRKELMSRYLAKEFVDDAVKTTSQVWNSELKIENILLKNIEDLKDNQAILTFKINPIFVKTDAAIEVEKKEANGKEIVKQVKKTKFIKVKVFFDKQSDKYLVSELPSFTYVDEQPNETIVVPETDELKKDDSENKEIEAFLETFFDSYANDPKEKLSYLFEDPENVSGLNQTMQFVKFEKMVAYKGKTDEEKVVTVDVIFKEPDTNIEFISPYTLIIKHTEQGYLVKYIDNKKYINDLKNSEKEDAENN